MSSLSYFCKERICCTLEGICGAQNPTGVAKHTAGVKEVQGGEQVSWEKLDLPLLLPPRPHLDSPLRTFSGGCDQSLLLASVSALAPFCLPVALRLLLPLSYRLISVCHFLFLSCASAVLSWFFLSFVYSSQKFWFYGWTVVVLLLCLWFFVDKAVGFFFFYFVTTLRPLVGFCAICFNAVSSCSFHSLSSFVAAASPATSPQPSSIFFHSSSSLLSVALHNGKDRAVFTV